MLKVATVVKYAIFFSKYAKNRNLEDEYADQRVLARKIMSILLRKPKARGL